MSSTIAEAFRRISLRRTDLPPRRDRRARLRELADGTGLAAPVRLKTLQEGEAAKLRGGDLGEAWAKKVLGQMRAADKEDKQEALRPTVQSDGGGLARWWYERHDLDCVPREGDDEETLRKKLRRCHHPGFHGWGFVTTVRDKGQPKPTEPEPEPTNGDMTDGNMTDGTDGTDGGTDGTETGGTGDSGSSQTTSSQTSGSTTSTSGGSSPKTQAMRGWKRRKKTEQVEAILRAQPSIAEWVHDMLEEEARPSAPTTGPTSPPAPPAELRPELELVGNQGVTEPSFPPGSRSLNRVETLQAELGELFGGVDFSGSVSQDAGGGVTEAQPGSGPPEKKDPESDKKTPEEKRKKKDDRAQKKAAEGKKKPEDPMKSQRFPGKPMPKHNKRITPRPRSAINGPKTPN